MHAAFKQVKEIVPGASACNACFRSHFTLHGLVTSTLAQATDWMVQFSPGHRIHRGIPGIGGSNILDHRYPLVI